MRRTKKPSCLFCGGKTSKSHACRPKGKSKRRNSGIVEAILKTLPEKAQQIYAAKRGTWESRPTSAKNEPWASQDDVWSRVWFVPGFKVENGSIFRTLWRFDDAGDVTFIDQYDVTDPSYFELMESFGEDARLATWRDYLNWVVENAVDPLDELKIESGDQTVTAEVWALAFRDFERDDVPIAVELIGAKPIASKGGLKTPDELPTWLMSRLRVTADRTNGAWIVGNYSGLDEFVPDLEAQGAKVEHRGEGICRMVAAFNVGNSAYTPRTEALVDAAKKALLALPAAENPRRKPTKRNAAYKVDVSEGQRTERAVEPATISLDLGVVPPLEDVTRLMGESVSFELKGCAAEIYQAAQLLRGPFEAVDDQQDGGTMYVTIGSPVGFKDLIETLIELDKTSFDTSMANAAMNLATHLLSGIGIRWV